MVKILSIENIKRLIEAGEYFVSENVEALDEIVGKLKIEN